MEKFKEKLLRVIGAYFLGTLVAAVPVMGVAYIIHPLVTDANEGWLVLAIFAVTISCMVGMYHVLGKEWKRTKKSFLS